LLIFDQLELPGEKSFGVITDGTCFLSVVDDVDSNCASAEARNTCTARWFTWVADVGMCDHCYN